MSQYGPHLLGRRPSPIDERDYKMRTILDAVEDGKPSVTDLDHALQAVTDSHLLPKALKHWAKLVTAALDAGPPLPSPTPVPGPNPVPIPDPVPTPDPDPVAPAPGPAAENPWHDADQLDQGETPHCVGFGWAQYGNTDPINDHFTNDDAHAIYYECKVIDGEPKAEDGSDVRSGAKAMQKRGRIGSYVFAETMADIHDWINTRGPIVIGSDWTNDMFSPDAAGFVTPTGDVAGGHCYLLVGYSVDGVLTFQNSWGDSFGLNGYFKMHEADFLSLLRNQGEACATAELAL